MLLFELLLSGRWISPLLFFFFFNDTATTEIYTLSLHDALPIFDRVLASRGLSRDRARDLAERLDRLEDRKSTRLNSSHEGISYAVFCLKKKTKRLIGVGARIIRWECCCS